MDFPEALSLVKGEIKGALDSVDPCAAQALARAIANAKRVFLTGQGRSGLVARAFAMRLMHLGLSAHVVGETTTPAIGTRDLLIAISCSGSTDSTCHFAKKAKSVGAERACVTSSARSRLARVCDRVVAIPSPPRRQTQAAGRRALSAQFGSTLFEQCSLILLDALCLVLMGIVNESHDRMISRHSNLE